MTISSNLMMAILSMDAYNRGYGAGFVVSGDSIGTISITNHSAYGIDSTEYEQWQNAGFYAVAYEVEDNDIQGLLAGQQIISYRGTDTLLSLPWTDEPGSDIWNGWAGGTGDPATIQALLAAEFYQAVTSSTDSNPRSTQALLTGHSLGGGLAGFIAAIYGQNATIFDNMPFELAATNNVWSAPGNSLIATLFYNGFLPNSATIDSNISAIAVSGEALDNFRQFQDTAERYLDSNSSELGGGDLHSQSLLVLLEYANQADSPHVEWHSIGTDLWRAMFSDAVGVAAGFESRGSSGTSDANAKLRTAIAYSVLDSGSAGADADYGYIFGNSAAQALFNDADALGSVVTAGRASDALEAAIAGIAEVIVQFAGLMASRKVNYRDFSQASFHPETGVVDFLTEAGSVTTNLGDALILSLDLSQAHWQLGQPGLPSDVDIVGVTTILQGLALKELAAPVDIFLEAMERLYKPAGSLEPFSVNHVLTEIQAGLASGSMDFDLHDGDQSYADETAILFIAGNGNDIIDGSKQNEIIVGGDGDDLLIGHLGKDILLGGVAPIPLRNR
ncbi:hypothetical protein ACO34A_01615 [Rhizobium sp. ACO-34A]|nr:hypothetical protein [Rhizobium sp. ACO-34A]ATN32506.1 hypothetical protein ACO34A_01615 [Rhizobium sp. ACO-34A]